MGLKNNINVGVSGHFKIEKTGADGEVLETYEFDNLVLDSGLELLSSTALASVASYCRVGTGNSTPNITQRALDNQMASQVRASNNKVSVYDGAQIVYESIYKFPASSVTGNITEIGVSSNTGGDLFNRQLIKDGEGNPTSISVLEQEGLNVYFTLKIYYNTDFKPFSSFTFNNVTYEIHGKVITKYFLGIHNLASGLDQNSRFGKYAQFPSTNVKKGIGTITFTVTLPSGEGTGKTISPQSDLTCGYRTGDFGVVAIQWYTVPSLVKDIYHKLTFDITLRIGRYGE